MGSTWPESRPLATGKRRRRSNQKQNCPNSTTSSSIYSFHPIFTKGCLGRLSRPSDAPQMQNKPEHHRNAYFNIFEAPPWRKLPKFRHIWPISEPNARDRHGESEFRVQLALAGQFGGQLGPPGGVPGSAVFPAHGRTLQKGR